METKRVSCFIGLLCIAMLLNSAAAEDTYYVQGPCSKFPDCNKHCKETGFKELGGKCVSVQLHKKGPLFCVCISH
ncbi:hypothetical protein ACP275_04G051000 [Erythranthe tilingii]